MSSFEWMELQALVSDIGVMRARLVAARSKKDQVGARGLAEEISDAEGRRDQLLAHITSDLADGSIAAPSAKQALQDVGEARQPVEPAGPITAGGATRPAAASRADNMKGGHMAWDQLTPDDIANAKQDIGMRRTEMQARHAEELQRLEADQSELAGLEQAIAAFLRKFSQPPDAAATLGAERELRQARG